MNNFPTLFAKMFSDSKIVVAMELGRTKVGCIINHDPAAYLKGKLLTLPSSCVSES